MAGDVQIYIYSYFCILVISSFLKFTLVLSEDFGLKFRVEPAQHVVAVPGNVVHLECSVNLHLDTITWHYNYAPLPTLHTQTFLNNKLLLKNTSQSYTLPGYLQHTHNYFTNREDTEKQYTIKTFSNGSSYLDIKISKFSALYKYRTRIYQCIASMGTVGLASSISCVDVGGITTYNGKPTLLSALKSDQLQEGQELHVNCDVTGYTPPIIWLNNGIRIMEDKGAVTIHNNGSLTVHHVSKDFAGMLQCFALSDGGSVSSQAFYTVLPATVQQGGLSSATALGSMKLRGSPHTVLGGWWSLGRPVVRRLADDAVEVLWAPPTDRSRLLFYKVQYRELISRSSNPERHTTAVHGAWLHNDARWKTDDTPISASQNYSIVTGLKTGATYKFRVVAAVSGSDNRVSAPSARCMMTAIVPLTAPPLPPHLQSVSRVPDGVLVRWSYANSSAETDGFIVSYTTRTQIPLSTKLRYLDGDRRSVVIPRVPAAETTVFRIQAFNMAGNSPYSQPRSLHDERSTKGRFHSITSSEEEGTLSLISNDNFNVRYRDNINNKLPSRQRGVKKSRNVDYYDDDFVAYHEYEDYTSSEEFYDSAEYRNYYYDYNDRVSHSDGNIDRSSFNPAENASIQTVRNMNTAGRNSGDRGDSNSIGGGISSFQVFLLLMSVLLALVSLVAVSYAIYARRSRTGYERPSGEQCSLQPLGPPSVQPSAPPAHGAVCGRFLRQQSDDGCQPQSPLSMPD